MNSPAALAHRPLSAPGLIAVCGAAGQLGQAVLGRLLGAGVKARAVARDPARVLRAVQAGLVGGAGGAGPAIASLDVRQADYADDSLVAALEGVHTVLLISVEGPDDERLALHRRAIDAAARAGVRRIAYTSILDVAPRSPFTAAAVHRQSEQAIVDTGLPCLLLRNGPYIDNLLARVARAAREDGTYRTSAGTARLPFIARADLALACAAALCRPELGQHVFEFTGPELLGFDDLAALVTRLLGRPVHCETVDDAAYEADLRRLGFSEVLVQRGVSYAQAMRQGLLSRTSSDFENLTGHPARRIADVLPTLGLERA